jgi:hypothetical protein
MGPIRFVFLSSIILCLSGIIFPLRANAHGFVSPPLPLHHATLAVRALSLHPVVHTQSSSINSLLSSFLSKGLQNRFRGALFSSSYIGIHVPTSITSRNFIQSERVIVMENVKAGAASVPPSVQTGGTISGGNLEGDLYFRTGVNQYINLGDSQYSLTGSGPGTGSLYPGYTSTTPGFVNSINFANGGSSSGSAVKFIHPSIGNVFELPVSSSVRNVLAYRNLLATTAYSLGQRSVPKTTPLGSLLGGQVYGSFYIGSPGPTFASTGLAFFAFGNSPFNVPSQRFNFITLANPSNFLTYSNKTVFPYNGQLAGTFMNGNPSQSTAILFAIGSNPNNIGLVFGQSLSMPQPNFLYF